MSIPLIKNGKSFKKVFFLLVGIILPFYSIQAQTEIDNEGMLKTKPVKVKEVSHSPQKALLFSTLLPGLGQAYNKQYWKIPVIYGGAGAIFYFARTNYKHAQRYKNEFIFRDHENTEAQDPNLASYPKDQIYNIYNSYQKDFELTLVFGGLVYLLNLLDAYVFAQLFSYDMNENLSMRISPLIEYSPFSSDTYLKSNLHSNPFNTGIRLTFSF